MSSPASSLKPCPLCGGPGDLKHMGVPYVFCINRDCIVSFLDENVWQALPRALTEQGLTGSDRATLEAGALELEATAPAIGGALPRCIAEQLREIATRLGPGGGA